MQKRVILVGPAYPYRGGIAHFLETMYRGLRSRGHEVSVVTFTRQYPGWLFPGKTQYETGPAENEMATSRLIDSVNPLSWFRTRREMVRRRPDLVVFQYWMPFFAPAFGLVARRLRREGIPVVAVVHNALPHERRPGDRWLSRYFFRTCSGFLVMSDQVGEDLEHFEVPGKVVRVEHPVYDVFGEPIPQQKARSNLGLPETEPVILFFGFIRSYKGLHVLLEALPRILERLPTLHLLVAGEFYDDPARYRDLIRRYGLERHVHLHEHYIPQESVRDYFSAADVVVQPYLSATQSGVAQIAFHFEKPLIVTDVGGLAAVVPHERAGLVVPPDDAQALAEAVIRYFTENLGETLAAGVRLEKPKYSWERLHEAVESFMTPG